LFEQDGKLIPEWAAFASHDFKGDDLRRRWDDDEELQKEKREPPDRFCGCRITLLLLSGSREYQAVVNMPFT